MENTYNSFNLYINTVSLPESAKEHVVTVNNKKAGASRCLLSLNIVNTSVIILENSTGTGLHKISAAHGTMATVPVIGSSKMAIIDQIDFK